MRKSCLQYSHTHTNKPNMFTNLLNTEGQKEGRMDGKKGSKGKQEGRDEEGIKGRMGGKRTW